MKNKILYYVGATILFLGFLWMFLPHAAHDKLLLNHNSHVLHTLQGAGIVIIGIIIMVFSNNKVSK